MTAVKDFNPKDLNDDPNFEYQLTSHLDEADLAEAREGAADNIATAGSSVPRAFFLRGGDGSRATPATELSGNVTAAADVARVDLSPSTASVVQGQTVSLTARVRPSSATDKSVSYSSSHTGIATVDSSGVVTGVAPTTKATVTLTSDATNVSDGDTVTLGSTVYRFKDTMAQAFDVKIGASAAATLDNLKAAVNASGTPGTEYYTGTTAHPTVEATTNTDTTQVFQAKTGGESGNSIASTESSSHLSFGAATLTGGWSSTTITVTTTDNSLTDTSVVTVTAS